MSFIDCIIQNKALSASQQEALVKEYEKLSERLSSKYGEAHGAQLAAQQYVKLKGDILTKKAENTVRDVLAWENLNPKLDRISSDYLAAKNQAGILGGLWGKSGIAAAGRSFLESVYTRQQSLERRITLAIADTIEKYRSKTAGLSQDVEGFKQVVRSLFGEKVDNADAAASGKAIREQFDNLHKMYQQSGGILGKLDNYFPQTHNPVAVGRVTDTEWADFIKPLLDREKMTSPESGIPLSDEELDKAIAESYEGIRTNGLDDIAARAEAGVQTFGKGGGIAMRRNTSRFLHFKSADAYFAYNSKFGYGDAGLFSAMMGHISSMTRDIAIMRDMGPNPAAQIARIKLKATAGKASPQALQTLQGMYDVLAGRTSYTGELPTWYKAISNTQHWLRSALLGGAPVSALSDSFFAGFTAKINGIPVADTLAHYAKLINPVTDKGIARRNAFIAGAASGHSIAQARFADDLGGHGLLPWLSTFTNRASWLGGMTDGVRQSIVLSTQGFFAEAKAMKLKWGELPVNMHEAFKRWGMDEFDYDIITGSTPHVEEGGADFIRPEDVALKAPSTARKYEMWLVDMAQKASNEPTLLTRAITTGAVLGDARQGTALRATASSLMMFKSFGISVMQNHLIPSMRHMATAKGFDRLARIAPMLIGTTIMGAAVMQAKSAIYGKTPQKMDKDFWKMAMMQGGGFGIFGDFLLSDVNRFGNNWQTTAAGPVAGFANDAYRVFAGNFDKALEEGTQTKFMSDFYQFSKRYIPGAKLWYTRLLIERMLLDQGERMIDPLFDTRMSRIESKMMHDKGQQFWWAPGQTAPH